MRAGRGLWLWDWEWWGLLLCESHNRRMGWNVGFGIWLMRNSEKLMKLDVKRREYDIVVIGEEPHLAYNRVGLTSFFQHREVENLYLNPKDWVRRFQFFTV